MPKAKRIQGRCLGRVEAVTGKIFIFDEVRVDKRQVSCGERQRSCGHSKCRAVLARRRKTKAVRRLLCRLLSSTDLSVKKADGSTGGARFSNPGFFQPRLDRMEINGT